MFDEMKLDTTLQYYRQKAKEFVEGTVSADMHDSQTRFLKLLPSQAYILDFGCGSGRDTKAFLEQGYRVDAVDGSAELCRMASELTGIPVKQMLFEDLSETELYDGIWACASILHLPRKELFYRKAGKAVVRYYCHRSGKRYRNSRQNKGKGTG